MKFRNPRFNFFLNGRTDKQKTDGRTSRKQYAPHLFKVGGIITVHLAYFKTGFESQTRDSKLKICDCKLQTYKIVNLLCIW